MYNLSITQTLLLILPYSIIYLSYFLKDKDNFFIRYPSHRKIDIYIWIVSMTILLFLTWNSYFSNYLFLGLKISQETIFFNDKFITFLGISSAIIGWLYTVRTQAVTNMRNHSIQTIMNARLSEQYNQKFDYIYELLVQQESLKYEKYIEFNSYDKSVVHYILNYYESIAIGIKYSELDEDIVKRMMRSQVLKTYVTFEDVIISLQNDSPTFFENFVDLRNRWYNSNLQT